MYHYKRSLVTRYPHLDLPLPLELVNSRFASRGQLVDALATPEDLDAWLQTNAERLEVDLSDVSVTRATPALLDRFRLLRAAVHDSLAAAIEAAPPSPAAVQLLNEAAAAAPRFPRLDVRDGAYHLHMVDGADSEAVVLASVARATMDLLVGPDLGRLRRCSGPGCVLFFLRERRRREWCSDACGNRARVARHYEHHRQAALRR